MVVQTNGLTRNINLDSNDQLVREMRLGCTACSLKQPRFGALSFVLLLHHWEGKTGRLCLLCQSKTLSGRDWKKLDNRTVLLIWHEECCMMHENNTCWSITLHRAWFQGSSPILCWFAVSVGFVRSQQSFFRAFKPASAQNTRADSTPFMHMLLCSCMFSDALGLRAARPETHIQVNAIAVRMSSLSIKVWVFLMLFSANSDRVESFNSKTTLDFWIL